MRLLKNSRRTPELKKGLLEIKAEQTQDQLKDSKSMLKVCYYLMPSTNKNISQKVIRECLNSMSDLRSSLNRREVCHLIFFSFIKSIKNKKYSIPLF